MSGERIEKRGRKPKEETISRYEAMEQKHVLYRGATLSDLAIIFRMDIKTIKTRIIGNILPNGKRDNTDTYLIREAAPLLVKPVEGVEQFLRNARPQDLPPLLSKEYWAGRKARQDFLLREGDLWPTDKVVDTISSAYKNLRTNMLLIPDKITQKVPLTLDQESELREALDYALDGLADDLAKEFQREPREDERPGSANVNRPDDNASIYEELGSGALRSREESGSGGAISTEEVEGDDGFDWTEGL